MKIDTYVGYTNDFILSGPPILDRPAVLETTPIVAQQFEDNFFERSGEILGDFVESGQLWALLIGVVLGYVIRGITTY